LNLSLEYSRELYEEETAGRMLGYYQALLEAIAANPERHISNLDMLGESERHKVLNEWNETDADYQIKKTIHELVSEQAARKPEELAVVCRSERLTYRELDEQSNRLARYLAVRGVAVESLVGVCLERSARMVVALLGILKAGGAYAPMDPSYPAERLAYMAEDSGMRLIVSQRSLIERLPKEIEGCGAAVICLDEKREEIELESEEPLKGAAGSDNLAYVIYTSGSTGRPKGVQIEHRAVVNFLRTMGRKPGMTAGDRLLSVTSLSFDIAGLELFLPLVVGAKVEIAASEEVGDGERLKQRLEEGEITVMQATPATWRMLSESGWKGNRKLKTLVGGEAIGERQAWELAEAGKEAWNMYGPTETTIWSSVEELKRGEKVSIGLPVGNTQMYVLDERKEAAGIGMVGELYIGGEGLARGYLGRAELTAEKFVPDVYGKKAGGRLYRTGDVVRRRGDGRIEYIGRADEQVKVRGYRIELKEVEQRLLEAEGVKQAVVVARADGAADKRLVAYVVPRQETALEPGRLRAHLRERLPEYMIPSLFVSLDQLPLTPNGKIDRKALPDPEPVIREYTPPRNATEADLASIWSAVLRADKIGVYDNFFDMGGYSLLAIQVISRARESFGVDLPVRRLFDNPTIAEMALAIEDARMTADEIAETDLIEALEEISDEQFGLLLDEIKS
jgi:amino acid adenylation domain-containing protein